MRVAINVRVSTEDQTVENQILRLTEFAQSKNWEYEVFAEVKSTRKSRPIKAELLKKLRNGEYDGVLIFKLDRFRIENSF